MNKQEFLNLLRDRLSCLREEDADRSLEYYSEIIDDRVEDGASEYEAVEALGSVDEIASQILMEISLPKLVKARVKSNRALKAWEIVLLILGSPVWLPLIAAAVIVVLSVYIVIWSVIVVLYSIVLCFGAGALAGILASIIYMPTGRIAQGALYLGAGLICTGITILLFFGFNKITKYVLLLSKKILLGIKTCFVGKGETR